MVDKTPAYNALLSIRATAQTEIEWIDGMVEASEKIVSVPNAGVQIVCGHLRVMKQIIESQDAIIMRMMESIENSDELLTLIKNHLNRE